MDGTAEQPALFGDIVCAASENGRAVSVCLNAVRVNCPHGTLSASDGGAV
jgi:hypothetical protein